MATRSSKAGGLAAGPSATEPRSRGFVGRAAFVLAIALGPIADAGAGGSPAAAEGAVPTCKVAAEGKDFSGQNLTDHNFRVEPSGALVGANFEDAVLKGAIFAGQTLTGSRLTNAAMSATTLVDAKLDFADRTCACFSFNKGDSNDINGKLCKDTPATTDPTGPAPRARPGWRPTATATEQPRSIIRLGRQMACRLPSDRYPLAEIREEIAVELST